MAEQGGKVFKIRRQYSNAVTFTDTGDLVGLVAHGLTVNDVVRFSVINTTTGISVDTDYYVKTVVDADSFTIAATPGGTLLALTTNGTGTMLTYKLVGGMRSKSLSLNSEPIDITNDDSAEWREILDSAGIRQMSVSGSGVFEDGVVFNDIMQDLLLNRNVTLKLITSSGGDKFVAPFKVTSLEQAGEYDGEMTYSLSLESAGEVVFTASA